MRYMFISSYTMLKIAEGGLRRLMANGFDCTEALCRYLLCQALGHFHLKNFKVGHIKTDEVFMIA